ncbi:hypothetical protein SAMN04490248_1028 [Salinihabitans flavidus]|uniref:Holin-X, holin superfamily III n=1 Tax=Salinihabitans flavidus TaxID=569882 RepID=A0A1H8MBR2_9RHOB|nr:hypothetical protein [Salinihabitans flavidus]SEO14596.1 hypothetical protein SAMN04490248_1028 [Salinihabitans flavidus]
MALPLWDPLRDLARAVVNGAGIRAATAIATALLAIVAIGFLVSAGLVALMGWIGFPAAALVFAVLFALLALAVYLLGRAASARTAARVRAARSRTESDIALATALARSARPLLPLAAFLAAFVLARRS